MPTLNLPARGEIPWDDKINAALETLSDGVDAAIPSAQKGAASGVAPLDPGSRVPDANLPTRLSDAQLTAKNAEQIAQVVPTLRAPIYGDPTGEPNGTPTHLSDGTAVTSFGNSPIVVKDGAFTHVPYAGANSGGYLQVADVGGIVNRVEMPFQWLPGETGSFALVLPAVPWFLPGGLSPAAFHLVWTHTGSWTIGRWNGTSVEIFRTGTMPAMDDGKWRTMACFRDSVRDDTWNLAMPDGSVVSVSHPTLASETGHTAIWEVYETNGVGVTPGRFGKIQVSAEEPAVTNPRDAVKMRDLHRLLAGASAGFVSKIWSPTAEALIAVPANVGNLADVNTANAFVTFTAPPSGAVRLHSSAMIEASQTSRYFQRFRIINGRATDGGAAFGTTPGIRQLDNPSAAPDKRRVHYEYDVTGLKPGRRYTAFLQHWYDQGGGGVNLRAGAGSLPIMLDATPITETSVSTAS